MNLGAGIIEEALADVEVVEELGRGAGTVVYLAESPDVAGHTGGYYVTSKRRNPSRAARDDVLAGRLWDVSARLTGLTG